MTDLAHSKGAKVIVNVGSPGGACLATQAEVVVNRPFANLERGFCS